MTTLQQRTPAWHAARKGKLTASNVGAALGLCPWTSRQQAFNRAMGTEKFLGKQYSSILGTATNASKFRAAVLGLGNDATRWGTNNEANGILAYTAHTGNVVNATGLHVHPRCSWLAGSPDGLVGEKGLLEVKCPYWRKSDGSRVHSSIPAHYYLQMNLCLEICERDYCDFISWAPEGYKVYRVTRDENLHDILLPHYLKFFAAMQRQARSPMPLSEAEKAQIAESVETSMAKHVDYNYWSRVDPSVPPPSPSYSDDSNYPERWLETETDDEAEAEPAAKRHKI